MAGSPHPISTSARLRIDRIDSRHRKVDWQYWPDATEQHSRTKRDDLTSSIPLRPDLEDEAVMAWGLSQSKVAEGPRAKIDVLHGQGSNLKWSTDVVDEKTLKDIMQSGEDNTDEHAIRICFINTLQSNSSWLPGNFSIRPEMLRIFRDAGLSGVLLSNLYSSEGYWAKMGNQQVMHHDDQGNLTKFELYYQYRCGWDTGVSFINFIRTHRQSTYICINYPSCALDRFKAAVEKSSDIARRDFFLDSLAADDSLKQWQFEIGHRRRALAKHEKQYQDGNIDFDLSTNQLHRMARHWLTLGQDISDLQAQLDFLRDACEKYRAKRKNQTKRWHLDLTIDMCDSFVVLKSHCDILKRWTQVYHDRTDVRINLLFHLANQRESRTNTQIASSTAKVAEQTQRDSASMITIAAMTMLFLPGTFISAILSTTYFDYGDDGLHVSRNWWVLLATTIPLTIVVFGVWVGWRYVRLQKQKSSLQD